MQLDYNLGIGSNLKKHANLNPNKVAIYYEDKEMTYKEFTHNIATYQKLLSEKLDPTENQSVALLLTNEPQFLEVYFAVIMLGWTAIPFDPKWTESEASQIKQLAEPNLIITNQSFTHTAKYQFSEAITLEIDPLAKLSNEDLLVADAHKDFYSGFTSGSTGLPKGFIRNQKSWLKSFEAGEEIFKYNENDILMAPGPLNHSLSLFGATHALHLGASFCLTQSFSARKVFDLINEQNVTVMYGVPTMLNSLATLELQSNKRVTFLSSGAKLQPKVKMHLNSVFPEATIYEYYGASELSYVTYATDAFNKRYPESVGIPFPSVKITIRNQVGEALPANEIGDIYIESDFLFSNYVKNKQATEETLTKYGVLIGDIGFLNEVGALTVVGRENNMIITGGQNVYPEEIEKVIKQSDSVKEAIIIGCKDTHWGERIIALIEWKDEKHPDLTTIKTDCKEQLSIYKRPRRYISVPNFPYTHTGKIAREQVKENFEEWIS